VIPEVAIATAALSRNVYGSCLVATRDVAAGETVERFEGPVVPWPEVPAEEVIYVISFEPYRWLIPRTAARYLNHSCDPNCMFLPTRDVVTVREVRAGEELTISYDWADRAEYARHPAHYFWDPRWSFRCHCRVSRCLGTIDRYRPV
jgi:hypothetical protein